MSDAAPISWPRWLYRKYFAKYPLCRAIKDWLVQCYYDLRYLQSLLGYACHYVRQSLSGGAVNDRPRLYYRMVPMHEFLAAIPCRCVTVAGKEAIRLPGLKMYGERPAAVAWPHEITLQVPDVQMVEIARAKVIGKSDFILHEDAAAHPDMFDPQRDVPPEEVHGFAVVRPSAKKLRFRFLYLEKMMDVDAAISLLGGCTGNYVHWLTETLSKLPLIDSVPEYRALPLLVDEGLPGSIMESLDSLNTHRRPVILVKRWQAVQANKIIAVTSTGYTPFEYRKRHAPDIAPGDTVYSPPALRALAASARALVADRPAGGKRLFIRRSSAHRQLLNFPEVAELLKERGFEEVMPETLSFQEQVARFSGAEIIVAQAGAALGNMLFAPKGCKVIALTSYTPYSNYYYFSNMAGILGHELRYVLGTHSPQPDAPHPAHGNLTIDPAALREALS